MKLAFNLALVQFRIKFKNTLKGCSIDHLKIMREEILKELQKRK